MFNSSKCVFVTIPKKEMCVLLHKRPSCYMLLYDNILYVSVHIFACNITIGQSFIPSYNQIK